MGGDTDALFVQSVGYWGLSRDDVLWFNFHARGAGRVAAPSSREKKMTKMDEIAAFVPVRRLAESYGLTRQRVLSLVKRNAGIPRIDTGSGLLVDAAAFARLRASRATRRPMRSTWRDDLPPREER